MLKNKYHVVGVMSGTSLDGVDLVFVTFELNTTWQFKIRHAKTYSYTTHWKRKLASLAQLELRKLKTIDDQYSIYLAEIIQKFIDDHQIVNLDFIASHGHTALHEPQNGITYQIGNRQVLADTLQQMVVCDFRVQDVALGGQGAPLVPVGDRLLFTDYDYCINLGGFANISYEVYNKRIAFDICPVNVVLNYYAGFLGLDYDNKGLLAQSGTIDFKLLNALNSIKFYNEKPPKSLGIEWVQSIIFPLIDPFGLQPETVLKTFIEHIAIQISKTIQKKNSKLLLTGGGSYNSFLVERLQYYTNSKLCLPSFELIEYKEALIFAFLGVLRIRQETNCLQSATGCKTDHSSGVILNFVK